MDKLKINPSELRHCGELQKFSRVEDGAGGYSEQWQTIITPFRFGGGPVTGYENYKAQGIDATVTHKFKARWNGTINPSLRLVWGSRVFDIKAVLNLEEENRVMVLLCEEKGVNSG
jgi:SPP1 family predicted phage head-tail adaptor